MEIDSQAIANVAQLIHERDALRAEVERYKRALRWLAGYSSLCDINKEMRCDAESVKDCIECRVERALSEARKEIIP